MTDTTDPVERAAREIAAVLDAAYHWDELAERWQNDYREAARKAFRVFAEHRNPHRQSTGRSAQGAGSGGNQPVAAGRHDAGEDHAGHEHVVGAGAGGGHGLAVGPGRPRATGGGSVKRCVAECHMPALIHVVFTATPDQKVGNGVYAGDSYCSLACLAKGALRIPLPEHEDEDDT